MFINRKFILYIILLSLIHVCLAGTSGAYYVNGVVDFSYSAYSSKIGDTRTSSSSWTEHYGLGAGGFIYDARLLRWHATVDYSSRHSQDTSDSDVLSYSINTSFFPGRVVSWDLFGSKGVTSVDSANNIAGYDVVSTTYGAALSLRLSSLRGRLTNNNNNNNYTNNNNNLRSYYPPLPDIFLSTTHQEAESRNPSFPLQETRDNHSAGIRYRLGSRFDLDANATLETFENELNGSGYETSSLRIVSTGRVSKNGELKLTGDMNERETRGLPGFEYPTIRRTGYSAQLDFKPEGRLAHMYRYDFSRQISGASEYLSQSGAAEVKYAYLAELSFRGGIAYSESESIREASGPVSAARTTMSDGKFYIGAMYRKVYSPEFLDPFTFSTGYDLASGYSSTKDELSGEEGKGRYYQNNVDLGLRSTGWKYELVSLEYAFVSKRDHSPLNHDHRSERFNLGLSTRRLPRTVVSANGAYHSQRSSSGSYTGVFLNTPSDTLQNTRSLQYNASIDHALRNYLSLNAGTSRGRTTSKTDYSLANITSDLEVIDVVVYAGLTFNYHFTRNLSFRTFVREEIRKREPGDANDTTAYIASSALNYRIRKIILNAEHRWREDIYQYQPRTEQQYFFVKASRPF